MALTSVVSDAVITSASTPCTHHTAVLIFHDQVCQFFLTAHERLERPAVVVQWLTAASVVQLVTVAALIFAAASLA